VKKIILLYYFFIPMRVLSAVFFCCFLALEILSPLFSVYILEALDKFSFYAVKISVPSPQQKR